MFMLHVSFSSLHVHLLVLLLVALIPSPAPTIYNASEHHKREAWEA
jgi:hypothetical protein